MIQPLREAISGPRPISLAFAGAGAHAPYVRYLTLLGGPVRLSDIPRRRSERIMPDHYFRITNCDGGTVEHLAEIVDHESAWTETMKVFGDLARDCILKENTEWRIELLGPRREPLYRIRLLAETCEAAAAFICLAADTGESY